MKSDKYFALVLFIFSGLIFLQGCDKKEDASQWKVKDPREEVNAHPEPSFKKEGELSFVKKDGKEIKKIEIEIADNAGERQQGLMWRKSMPETNGMLFVFDKEEPQSFWMKNTIIPLDIMYVNEKKEIVKIYKNTTPYSEKPLPSEKNSIYVIETVAGFSDRFGVKEGDKVDFNSAAK